MEQQRRIPDYLPYSLGILWLWSGLQPVLTAPQESLSLLAEVGLDGLPMAAAAGFIAARRRLRPAVFQPHAPPARTLGGTSGNGGGIQSDYRVRPATNVAAPVRTVGQEPVRFWHCWPSCGMKAVLKK